MLNYQRVKHPGLTQKSSPNQNRTAKWLSMRFGALLKQSIPKPYFYRNRSWLCHHLIHQSPHDAAMISFYPISGWLINNRAAGVQKSPNISITFCTVNVIIITPYILINWFMIVGCILFNLAYNQQWLSAIVQKSYDSFWWLNHVWK